MMAKTHEVLKNTVHVEAEGIKTFLAGTRREDIPAEFADELSGEHLWVEAEEVAQSAPVADTAELDGLKAENEALRARVAELEAALAAAEEAAVQVPGDVEYNDLEKADLKKIAAERGIEVPSSANKTQLVEALTAADAAKADEQQ